MTPTAGEIGTGSLSCSVSRSIPPTSQAPKSSRACSARSSPTRSPRELAEDAAAEVSRGSHFSPPLSSDELAFYDAVATNESTVDVQGEGVLAQIARELVAVIRRDVRTDWTVRDGVRAKLRSSIQRLLVKYKYPLDKQPEAIKLVIDQMELMAPRYADEGRPHADRPTGRPAL